VGAQGAGVARVYVGAQGAGVARVYVGAEGAGVPGFMWVQKGGTAGGTRVAGCAPAHWACTKGGLFRTLCASWLPQQSACESTKRYVICAQPIQECAEGHGVQQTGCAAAQLHPKSCSAPAKTGFNVQGGHLPGKPTYCSISYDLHDKQKHSPSSSSQQFNHPGSSTQMHALATINTRHPLSSRHESALCHGNCCTTTNHAHANRLPATVTVRPLLQTPFSLTSV
jgi:hypothetical protein